MCQLVSQAVYWKWVLYHTTVPFWISSGTHGTQVLQIGLGVPCTVDRGVKKARMSRLKD